MTINRRNFLGLTAAGISGAISPFGVSGSLASGVNYPLLDHARTLISQKPVTLKILFPQGSINNIKPVAQKFCEVTGAKVEYVETTVDDINTHILNSSARQSYDFDIALPATFGIPDLVEANALTDLTRLAIKHEPPNGFRDSLYALVTNTKARNTDIRQMETPI